MKLTQAQIARIKALETKHGRLSARRLVEDAKSKRSPLHSLFPWNLRKAAEITWLARARDIIGAVKYVHHTTDHTIKAPAYVFDPSQKGGGYQSVAVMRADPSSARESLIFTLKIASGHIRRAFDLAGPLGLEAEVDQLLAQIAGLMRVAEKKKAA